MSKLSVRNLYKVFGKNADEVVEQVRGGAGKQDVLRRTGHTVGLNDVSLDIEPGETFVVMGLSGSGKSTLIRCLNRLVEPTAGQILIDGKDIVGLGRREMQRVRREKMGMVFQHFALLPHRNILDNVAYGLKLQGIPKAERYSRARKWIEVVGLKGYEKSRPADLSGGMQQRVGLARALATDPEILLMDEAFSALDPLIRREMQDELVRLQQELNKTIVFITHDLDEALRLGDRVAILKAGQVVQVGTPEEILTSPANDYVEAFVKNVDRSRVLTARIAMQPGLAVPVSTRPTNLIKDVNEDRWKTAYVTREDGTYLGVASLEQVRTGARRGDSDLSKLVSEDVPTALSDCPLSELFSVSADSDLPLAVLNGSGKLLGVLSHQALLQSLAGDQQVDLSGIGGGVPSGQAREAHVS